MKSEERKAVQALLLPCPFCGCEEVRFVAVVDFCRVYCTQCIAMFQNTGSLHGDVLQPKAIEKMVMKWNSRV